MKILLFGANGQVGWELQRALVPLGEVVALDRSGVDRLCGDLTHVARLEATVRKVRPEVIVNAAAYTAVDLAESEPAVARAVNAVAPGVLAREAAALGAWLVHYGTDHVFDGSGSAPWCESDPTGPLNVYGRTKLEGEQAIRASGCLHLILRTGWVFSARGPNFAKNILQLARERDALQVVCDQVGAPTGADLLADLTAHIVRAAVLHPQLAGIYHAAAAGETSRHGYADFVVRWALERGLALKVRAESIEPVSSGYLPCPALRPLNARLDTTRLRSTFALNLPDWRSGVRRMLAEVVGQQGG
jgi:dTDP-4-dehydrorhamnose reductase